MRVTVICATIFGAVFGSENAESCSLGRDPVAYNPDFIVIVGSISSYRDQILDSGPAIGFGIEPVIVYSQLAAVSPPELTIVPVQIGVGCEPKGLHPTKEHFDEFPIGKLVGIYVGPSYTPEPRVVYGLSGFSLDMIHESCDLEIVRGAQGDWTIPRQCGSTYFHANALVATFPITSSDEIKQYLGWLASYPGWIRYEDLVNEFVSNEDDQQELMMKRYGDLTEVSCRESAASFTADLEQGFLRREFCSLSPEE